MLHLNWNQYLLYVALAAGGYYVLIILLFFKGTAFELVQRALPLKRNSPYTSLPDITELKVIANTITGILEAGKEAGKAELLASIKPVLANYDGLRLPAYRVALFNHIILKAEFICGVRITEAELDRCVDE